MRQLALFAILVISLCFTPLFAKAQVTPEQLHQMAFERVQRMSLKEKIGQKLMLDFNNWCVISPAGDKPCTEKFTQINDAVKKLLSHNHIGGVILFSDNIKNSAQITTLTHELQLAMSETKNMPLFIAADQEGGVVARLPRDSSVTFPGNMAMAAAYLGKPGLPYVSQVAAIMATNLKAVGININLAPDIDVNVNSQNPVIHVRSFSDDPLLVTKLGLEYSQGLQSKGVASTLKHFPGHGDTITDSHVGLPVVTHNIDNAWNIDLYPFKTIIEQNPPDLIMTAHIQFPALDNTRIYASKTGEEIQTPATLSRIIEHNLLRDQLGFHGVIITDALDMGAIANNFAPLDATIKAFQAGDDIALMPLSITCEKEAIQVEKLIEAIQLEVLNGNLSITELDASVMRILELKIKLGLLQPDTIPLEQKIELAQQLFADPSQRALENAVTDDAITLVQNNNNLIPIQLVSGTRIYIITPSVQQGKGIDQAIKQLQAMNQLPKDIQVQFTQFQDINIEVEKKAIDNADIVIVGNRSAKSQPLVSTSDVNFSEDKSERKLGKSSLSLKNSDIPEAKQAYQLLQYAKNHGKKTLFISLLAPYDLPNYKDVAEAMFAVYNPYGYIENGDQGYYGGPSMQALTRIIFGISKPYAKLPVAIPNPLNLTEILYPRGFGLSTNPNSHLKNQN